MAYTVGELNTQMKKNTEEGMDDKYLTYWMDNRLFAISIQDVVQIVQVQEITEVPDFPHYAKGVMNLRGSLIPIIDMRLRFGKEEIPYSGHTCIIVVYVGKKLIGFIVDAVEEVTTIGQELLMPPPMLNGDIENTFISGICNFNGRVVMILDTKKLFVEDNLGAEIAAYES